MTWANFDDARNQVTGAGLLIDELLVDTHKPQRCYTTDDSREKRGWYWLNTKEIGGAAYITGSAAVLEHSALKFVIYPELVPSGALRRTSTTPASSGGTSSLCSRVNRNPA